MEVQGTVKLIDETKTFGTNGLEKRAGCDYRRAVPTAYND